MLIRRRGTPPSVDALAAKIDATPYEVLAAVAADSDGRFTMWTEGGRAFVFPPAWLPQFPLPSIHPCVPVYLPARLPARLPAKAFNLMHYSQSESDPS